MRLAVNRLDMKSDNKNLCYIIKSANHQPHHRLRTRTKTRFQRVQRRAHAGVHIRVCFVYYYDKVGKIFYRNLLQRVLKYEYFQSQITSK